MTIFVPRSFICKLYWFVICNSNLNNKVNMVFLALYIVNLTI